MSFDELWERVDRRLTAYQESGDAEAVLNDAALDEAAELWRAAQPANPDHPTPSDTVRLAVAGHVLGWLHFFRDTALSSDEDLSEVAQAIVFFEPLANDPDVIPKSLRDVLGPAANAEMQADLALGLLEQAMIRANPHVLDAACSLFAACTAASPADRPERAGWLSNLALAYRLRYECGGVVADLERAIEVGRQAEAMTPADHLDRAAMLLNLGLAHQLRYQHHGEPVDLEQSIEVGRQAEAMTPADHLHRAAVLYSLGNAYGLRYKRVGVLADLEQAIELCKQGLAAIPDNHPNRTAWLSNLGVAYGLRYERNGELADLDHAIAMGESVVAVTMEDDPERVDVLFTLGSAYESRYERVGKLADLERALDLGHQALAAIPDGHPDRAGLLCNLGNAYQSRYERVGKLADLERALDLGHQALAAIPDDYPDRALWLSNLGVAYRLQYERSGALAALESAIDLGHQALAAIPHNHPDRAGLLSNLCLSYKLRYERTGALADLQHAIEFGSQAVAAIAEDHHHRGMCLTNLGVSYALGYERTGALADLEHAIDLETKALAITPEDHPDRAAWLSNLCLSYKLRYERTGALADLQHAIEFGSQAVAATPEDQPIRAMYLNNLALAHGERYERYGALDDLDQAIELGGQALATAPEDHPERAAWLSNLGSHHQARYERVGVLADLEQAINLNNQAVATIPEDHPDRAGLLYNLGLAYDERYERTRALPDLEHAIDLETRALAITPADHPHRAARLSALGNAYQARHQQVGALADVEEAIKLGSQAVATTPSDHADRARWLSNLGLAYQARYESSGTLVDLNHAIELGSQAVAATPEDHPDRASYLNNLCTAYRTRFEVDGQGIDRKTLRALTRQITAVTTASPADWVWAARVAGSLAHAMNEHTTAVKLLDAAVATVPLVAPRESGWADQEHRLGHHTGLVGEAVAAHCALNDPVAAVEAAELSRGILLASHFHSRTDLTDLDHADPHLAARFRKVRDQLNTPSSTPSDKPSNAVQHIEDRKRWWAEHDALLAEIRQHPRFTRFLLPPRLADLQHAAADGAVVLVNAGRRRSDAIIVTAEAHPILLHLPELTRTDIESQAVELLEATYEGGQYAGTLRRQRVLREILSWLWTSIVQPTLHTLPPEVRCGAPLPRVWWMPTGLLGLFPLHAAGHPGQPGALDAVISSYAPTLRALAHTRQRPAATTRRQLTVALEHTPGLEDLRNAANEAADLRTHHPDSPSLVDQNATTGRVLAALPQATWAHFACHASTDFVIPSNGGLHLYDATLTLPDISRLQLTDAELAYLSACSTANRGIRHTDESINLASAFQLAGFKHVIATLWPLNDNIAATAARSFYRELPSSASADEASISVHNVITQLRTDYPDHPDLWAGMVHSGP